MRFVLLAAAMWFGAGSILWAEDSTARFSTNYFFVSRDGDKISGGIGACLMHRADKPVACFGLTKSADSAGRYTFLVLFKTGDKKFQGSDASNRVTANGKTTTTNTRFTFGKSELPFQLVERLEEEALRVVALKLMVGDKELTDQGPRVVLADLTGENPSYRLVQVELPKSVPDLADLEEKKTWPAALDMAIKELKEKSAEVKRGAD